MSQVIVTLPDGSSRTLAAGSPVSAVAAEISPGLAKAALAGIVDGKLVDLAYPIQQDAAVRIVTDRSPEALPLYRHSTAHLLAAAVTNLFPGTQCGIGPATDEGFFYDFVVERPFVPEDLDAIEKKMKDLASQDLVYERQLWPREEAKAFFAKRGEALKVQLIDEKTEGQTRGVLLHHQGPGHLRRLLRRPARAVDRQAEGVQAAEHLQRVLEGRCAQPADAAGLRHRVLFRQGPEGASDADRGGEEARSPQAGPRARSVHLPSVGSRRGILAGQGDDALQPPRQLHAGRAAAEWLRRGEDAAHLQQGTLGDVRALVALSRQHVPDRVGRGTDGGEGDELPRPLPAVRDRSAQLPRSAAALPRTDAASSQRGVGRAGRSDPRAAVLAGRRPLLRDAGTDRRGGREAARVRPARLSAISGCRTRRSCRPVRRSFSATWRRGIRRRRS